MKIAVLPLLAAAVIFSPALAQDDIAPSWNLVASGGEAFLTYGIPETDDGGPSLSCVSTTKTVKASMWVEKRLATDEPTADGSWVDAKGRPAPWKGELTIASGTTIASLPALVHPEEMYGGSIVTAEVAADAPVMAAFAASGRIEFRSFGEKSDLPPAPRPKVVALLRDCIRR